MLFNLSIQELIFLVPILLLSLSVHEFAHGLASTLLGDSTPRNEGRLTLNPLAHLDLYGTLMLLIVGFGWAKPVHISTEYYKRPYLGLVITSLAGPVSNLLIALIMTLILRVIFVTEALAFLQGETLLIVFQYVTAINVLLFVFNLIPIPPLDGSRVVTALMNKNKEFIQNYNRYGMFVLLGLLMANRIFGVEILPITSLMRGVLSLIYRLILV